MQHDVCNTEHVLAELEADIEDAVHEALRTAGGSVVSPVTFMLNIDVATIVERFNLAHGPMW